ncbi:sugar ABC transporter substrate-binding protein [Pseudonocardia sp. GCM10023141]|uniref:sugar ABC transporter substrate-binding protein n=1 Tax=Pseudonocardia sp. GCM10023141 TaxID=3252653 RepID=UPI0036207883
MANATVRHISRVGVLRSAAALAAGVLVLAGCGANASAGSSSASGPAPAPAESKGTIGVILPETATSARWEAFDKPFLADALSRAGFTANIQNAQGDVQKFAGLADGMIASGVKALIIASPNAQVGATVEQKAKQAGIPTIDYDRLNTGGSADYYVTFDNVKVGVLQANALVAALKDKPAAEVIQIEGAPDENNANLFHQGQMSVLDPLYKSGQLKLVRDQFIPDWNNQLGGTTFEQILTANGSKVDGVVAANDGMAGAVITVLQKNGLNGKVPVTGQDATLAGLQSILRGDQSMTVFKAIKLEADAAAKLAALAAVGDTAGADTYAKQQSVDPKSGRNIKSVLLDPEVVDKSSVKKVVDAGYVTAAQLCTTDLATVCRSLGITS